MKYRAKISFSGKLCMYAGEIREINHEELEKDLLHAGYIEPINGLPEENIKTDSSSEKAAQPAEEKSEKGEKNSGNQSGNSAKSKKLSKDRP